ncbi:LOW QUALITY PROTEIN: cell surface hyaluronidase-like [Haliotis rubra]|uniref:LOW QUALITY PROTEIN: cell surface hyaluronidase-like n=1 Tax=Haliotis rubra TaxID=36100 RepID=UPI001EE573D4|nr:LOW QUALITY PROTEIN: cell surface hyaluronidase-like [Haliotis rubra]
MATCENIREHFSGLKDSRWRRPFSVVCLSVLGAAFSTCPHTIPGLKRWSRASTWPGSRKPALNARVVITEHVLLDESPPELHSIIIESRGRLVWSPDGDYNVTTQFILIKGQMDIGSEDCKFPARAHVTLTGIRGSYKVTLGEHLFGEKFIGVAPGGTLEMHGEEKLPWTKLTKTLPKLDASHGLLYDHLTSKHKDEGSWKDGINAYIFDGNTGNFIQFASYYLGEYDKYHYKSDPAALAGLINDLSSTQCSIKPTPSLTPGDRIFITSTDYLWEQLETATVKKCTTCRHDQVQIDLEAAYMHWGEMIDRVDERAEVGLLTRNIVIEGRMENTCPPSNANCDTYNYDTFGGHLKFVRGYKNVHIEGVELTHMGQQSEKGFYPIHFHMCHDVDKVGGYSDPAWVRQNSIHHTFSRCVTVHGSHGVTVQDNVAYDHLGHCYFLEDGGEKRNVFDGNLGAATKHGTILPSDKENPATFWMTSPLVYLRNNVAAGGNGIGIWYVFPEEPQGPSYGLGFLQRGEARHTALLEFNNNVGHSNTHYGLFVDNIINPDDTTGGDNMYDPRQQPLNKTSAQKEVLFYRFTGYKNRYQNGWIRGGLILMDHSSFADSGRGMTFAKYVPLSLLHSTGNRVYDGNETVHGFGNDDGDKTSAFRDLDGSVTGYPGSTVLKPGPFFHNARCYRRDNWNMEICPQRFGMLNLRLISTEDQGKSHPFAVRDDNPSARMDETWHSSAGFPVALGGDHSYTIHWKGRVPRAFELKGEGVEKGDWVRFGVCFPRNGKFHFTMYYPVYRDDTGWVGHYWKRVSSVEDLDRDTSGGAVYHDNTTGLWFFKYMNMNDRLENETHSCPERCPSIRFEVLSGDMNDGDCTSRAYGPYKRAPITGSNGLHANSLQVTSKDPPQGWGAGPTRPFETRTSTNGQGGQWTAWSQCSQSCGGGLQTRTRSCDGAGSTEDCQRHHVEYRACNTAFCTSQLLG